MKVWSVELNEDCNTVRLNDGFLCGSYDYTVCVPLPYAELTVDFSKMKDSEINTTTSLLVNCLEYCVERLREIENRDTPRERPGRSRYDIKYESMLNELKEITE